MSGDKYFGTNANANMGALARQIDRELNGNLPDQFRTVGFVLFVFPFGVIDGRANYIANASRELAIKLLEQQLAKLKGGKGPLP